MRSDISHLLLFLLFDLSSHKRNENGKPGRSQTSRGFLEFGSVRRGGGYPHNGDTLNKSENTKK
eukprot:4378472-Amphidinium_carterae.1